jgi:hypothetical protein
VKRLLALLIVLLILSGCDDDPLSPNRFEAMADESRTVSLTSQTELIMEVNNGEITVTASDTAAKLYCDITKMVRSPESTQDAESHLSEINIIVEENPAYIKFKVENPDDNRDYNTRFNILMPDNFNFNLALGNGDINLVSTTKRTILTLGNGNIDASVITIDTCFVRSSLGNGNTNLSIPEATNAFLTASVGNGSIINNGLNFQDQQSTNRQFSGRLGNGTGTIMLSNGNGTLTLNKL